MRSFDSLVRSRMLCYAKIETTIPSNGLDHADGNGDDDDDDDDDNNDGDVRGPKVASSRHAVARRSCASMHFDFFPFSSSLASPFSDRGPWC